MQVINIGKILSLFYISVAKACHDLHGPARQSINLRPVSQQVKWLFFLLSSSCVCGVGRVLWTIPTWAGHTNIVLNFNSDMYIASKFWQKGTPGQPELLNISTTFSFKIS